MWACLVELWLWEKTGSIWLWIVKKAVVGINCKKASLKLFFLSSYDQAVVNCKQCKNSIISLYY
jgi:hypothetical protein